MISMCQEKFKLYLIKQRISLPVQNIDTLDILSQKETCRKEINLKCI